MAIRCTVLRLEFQESQAPERTELHKWTWNVPPLLWLFGLLHVSDEIEILKEASSFLHLRIDPIVSRFGLLGCCSSSRYHWWVHSSMVKMQRSSRPVLPSASATNHRRSQVRSVSESTGVLSGLFMHAHAPTPSPWLARCRTAVERVCWLVTPVHPNAVEQVGGATIQRSSYVTLVSTVVLCYTSCLIQK